MLSFARIGERSSKAPQGAFFIVCPGKPEWFYFGGKGDRVSMMKKIEKKVWPEYFREIADGKKTFELRLNDFEVSEGDVLVLREWDPKTKDYTGRQVERTVGFVGKWKIDDLTQFWPRQDIDEKGIQVISLKN